MNDATRQKVIDALMDGCPADLREIEEICVEDADKLEPIIDDLEEQAERRGRFQALLEQAERWGQVLARAQTKPLTRKMKSIY
jgi:hypothetical protein